MSPDVPLRSMLRRRSVPRGTPAAAPGRRRRYARGMSPATAVASLLLAVALLAADPAAATPVAQQRGNPCDAVWDLGQAPVTVLESAISRQVDCIDGDPRCDADGARNGRCAIGVRACVGSTRIAGCVPVSLTKPVRVVRARRLTGFVAPASLGGPDACGTPGTIVLALRGRRRKPSRPFILEMRTRTAEGSGSNRVRLVCRGGTPPSTTTTSTSTSSSTTTSTTIPCPARASGLPQQATLTVQAAGSDVDVGVHGPGHNGRMVSGSTLALCLDGCDASTSPVCAATGPVGDGTVNGATFGAPEPVYASGVGFCLVKRFREPVHASIDLATGAIPDARLPLVADIHVRVTDAANICPRCTDAVCTGNARNDGAPCAVDGQATIPGSGGDATYTLSRACLPAGDPTASISLTLPLTTETASIAGPRPCERVDDGCTGDCVPECAPTPPAKGGIHQTCCDDDPNRACFPTASGTAIERTGTRSVPQPAWPDPTYPKTGGGTLVAAFCIPRTNDSTLDGTLGLPGPGAVVVPVTHEVAGGAP